VTRARSWAGTAAVVAKTIVVLLAALQLLQLLGVTRVELARAETRTEVVGEPAVTDQPRKARPVREKVTAAAVAALQPPPARPVGVKALAQRMAAQKGWTGREWTCLHTLVARESSWDPTAQNPTSTAFGLFQFLNRTWATVGARKTSDPEGQIRAGLTYVERRYGTPCSAWAFWLRQSPHWY
jgi:hypothetical protein